MYLNQATKPMQTHNYIMEEKGITSKYPFA